MSASTTELCFVNGDDWSGLYAGGVMLAQGHCRQGHADLLALAADHQPFTVRHVFADEDWLMDVGQLPETLDAVRIRSEQPARAELAMQ